MGRAGELDSPRALSHVGAGTFGSPLSDRISKNFLYGRIPFARIYSIITNCKFYGVRSCYR